MYRYTYILLSKGSLRNLRNFSFIYAVRGKEKKIWRRKNILKEKKLTKEKKIRSLLDLHEVC
jgi:hypothetical protein